ncbi:GNAT family N-acetyltransferase [Gottfriedia solisilvae]|uniref:Putative N-acetyltransferase YhfO n=1 Tax=Gottfriedia solisilvae TaxID=1516104 RepID=A0A8J3EZH0_9BACI|nr:GNAT family N-acetyltransferase [Gottfriedia solisilvae]GGI15262.1 putative N-acetyltransferase YhfO [Gottfriedia solisilvae]
MRVFQAKTSEVKEVAKLFDQYRVFYKQESNIEAAEAFISERMENNESVILVVEEEGEFLGFTQLYPSFSSVSMKRLWILNDLFVSKTARNKGVAQYLLDTAKQFAIETSAKSLDLQTANDNFAAQALYEKNGYELEKDFRSYSLMIENQL